MKVLIALIVGIVVNALFLGQSYASYIDCANCVRSVEQGCAINTRGCDNGGVNYSKCIYDACKSCSVYQICCDADWHSKYCYPISDALGKVNQQRLYIHKDKKSGVVKVDIKPGK